MILPELIYLQNIRYSTNCEDPHYVISFDPLLCYFSALCFQTSSICVLPSSFMLIYKNRWNILIFGILGRRQEGKKYSEFEW
jgi:hypothetical protein